VDELVRIYANEKRSESKPFPGWRYYTEYGVDEEGNLYAASGVNQETDAPEG
jgi:hypothetical protein